MLPDEAGLDKGNDKCSCRLDLFLFLKSTWKTCCYSFLHQKGKKKTQNVHLIYFERWWILPFVKQKHQLILSVYEDRCGFRLSLCWGCSCVCGSLCCVQMIKGGTWAPSSCRVPAHVGHLATVPHQTQHIHSASAVHGACDVFLIWFHHNPVLLYSPRLRLGPKLVPSQGAGWWLWR